MVCNDHINPLLPGILNLLKGCYAAVNGDYQGAGD